MWKLNDGNAEGSSTDAMLKFSIIIPAHNSAGHLLPCIESLRALAPPVGGHEIILVDDASTDETVTLASTAGETLPALRVVARRSCGGPGAARNSGLEVATGQWVIFLDSDDELQPEALVVLEAFIEQQATPVDAVGYDWTAIGPGEGLNSSKRVGRRDGNFLGQRERLMHLYLTHRMDGSAIYTAVCRDLLERNRLRFASGLHEDVDFIFRVYFHAQNTAFLPRVLYRKRNRATSIINRISIAHLDGYFRAWTAIGNFLQDAGLPAGDLSRYWYDYRYGTIGAIATRVREVVRHGGDAAVMAPLFERIASHVRALVEDGRYDPALEVKTVYGMITGLFWRVMNGGGDSQARAVDILANIRELQGKSWSCVDLHHSLFLRADEVRTCCKRFFVAGQMRGDVSLFRVPPDRTAPVSSGAILAAKQALHQAINSGEPSACDGCPFLEFREWSPLNELDITYLSMEQHTVCNLRCTYCSEDYFGGKQPIYDVPGTLAALMEQGVMKHCHLVVWGGGDPVLARDFEGMVTKLAHTLPAAQQRVLTNAVEHSPAVEALLKAGRAQVITSIDAGIESTFKSVRGRPGLDKVCRNLATYAGANTDRVTVKYIFTDGNSTVGEVRAFAALMEERGLLGCHFQLSCDFKHEGIHAEATHAMLLLYGLLRKGGARGLYLDELVRQRLGPIAVDEVHRLAGFEFIAQPAHFPRGLIIWGAGQQAKHLLTGTIFFKQVPVVCFVDATPSKIGTRFMGADVRDPATLAESDLPVLLAAVQGYPLILEQYKGLGFPESRLVQELIL